MTKMTTTEDRFVVEARRILNKSYARRLVPEHEGGYSASIQEFPGCFAEGDSAVEALERLDDAAESWVAAHLASGNSIREPIAFHGASGKIALRIPRGLHQQVCELAEAENCSVNQLLTAAIAEYVGRAEAIDHVKQVINHAVSSLRSLMSVQIVDRPWDAQLPHQVETIQIGMAQSFVPFSFSTSGSNYLKVEHG